jgi:hypothetical protein
VGTHIVTGVALSSLGLCAVVHLDTCLPVCALQYLGVVVGPIVTG